MLMAAVAFNLKKYMRFTSHTAVSQAMALRVEWSLTSQDTLLGGSWFFYN